MDDRNAIEIAKEVVKQIAKPVQDFIGAVLGKPANPEVDHVKPKSKGGNNTRKNAQLTCRTCNRSKGANSFPKNYPIYKQVVWYVNRVFSFKWLF